MPKIWSLTYIPENILVCDDENTTLKARNRYVNQQLIAQVQDKEVSN